MTGMDILVQIIGSVGAIALLASYVLISKKRVTSDSYTYQTLNLIGSILLIVNGLYFGAYPSGVLNIIWGSLASYEVWKISRKSLQGG
jgi:hypothetical protein